MSSKCQMIKPAATTLMVAALGATAFGAQPANIASGQNLSDQWQNARQTSVRNLTAIDVATARVEDPTDPTKRSVVWWDNGERDNNLAVLSQSIGGEFPFEQFVADDFFLQKGCWYHFNKITVVFMVWDDEPRNYALEILTDCDGLPDASFLGPYTTFTETEIAQGTGNLTGFTFYQVEFEINEFVKGYERLWLKPYGVSDDGQYFWVSANDLLVQGRQGHVQFDGGEWLPVDEECVFCDPVCTDFAFVIEGQVCKVLKDNENYITTGGNALVKAPNLTGSNVPFAFAAVDDFQVPPGRDQQLCKLKVYVASNCIELIRAALYENECDMPAGSPIELAAPAEINLIEGASHKGLPVYEVVWVNNENQPLLSAGRNYWLAISFPTNLIGTHRAFWLFKAENTCETININPAKFRGKDVPTFTAYEDISDVTELGGRATDHAFKLWTNDVPCEENGDSGGTTPESPIAPSIDRGNIGSTFFGSTGGTTGSASQTMGQIAR